MNAENQTPRLINWMGYLAIAFTVLLPTAVLCVRAGAWQPGLLLYAVACLGSVVVLLICIILLLRGHYAPWRRGIGWRALIALPGALLLLQLIASGGDYPPIHDITTDTVDPPRFVAAPVQRGEDANSLDVNPDTIAQQLSAYPQIKPLSTPLNTQEAYARAVKIAESLKWHVYHQDRTAGVIEAVATTGIMGFKDDVVIRIRSAGSGSQLDLRSVSRVGESDLGANALRIHAFIEAFQKAGE